MLLRILAECGAKESAQELLYQSMLLSVDVAPMVTKGEYYFGVKIWWLFLVMGIAAVAGSIAVRHILWSTLLAVWGASSLWSIGELFEQRERVAKGWFPKNPKRK